MIFFNKENNLKDQILHLFLTVAFLPFTRILDVEAKI